jgi:hypothetical protein
MKVLRYVVGVLSLAVCFLLAPMLLRLSPPSTTHAQQSGYSYVDIEASGSVQVATTPVTLHTIVLDGGPVGTITVYDNAAGCSGTKISTIATSAPPVTLIYDVQTKNGICVSTSTNMDATVSYR